MKTLLNPAPLAFVLEDKSTPRALPHSLSQPRPRAAAPPVYSEERSRVRVQKRGEAARSIYVSPAPHPPRPSPPCQERTARLGVAITNITIAEPFQRQKNCPKAHKRTSTVALLGTARIGHAVTNITTVKPYQRQKKCPKSPQAYLHSGSFGSRRLPDPRAHRRSVLPLRAQRIRVPHNARLCAVCPSQEHLQQLPLRVPLREKTFIRSEVCRGVLVDWRSDSRGEMGLR